MAARNLLGETFGTRKLEQQIRSQERNQVNARSLDPLAGLIESRLDAKADHVLPADGARQRHPRQSRRTAVAPTLMQARVAGQSARASVTRIAADQSAAVDAHLERAIPPFNATATEPAGVYRAEDRTCAATLDPRPRSRVRTVRRRATWQR